MTLKQKLIFWGIIVLAVFFRFYLINKMPGGLFPDEAANGLDINLMQQGHLQPFYERGNGREALFFYMQWASTAIFGKGQAAMHITSAFVGVLAVVMVYFVTFRLFLMDADLLSADEYERKRLRAINIALLASFLMAVSTWHVVLSRTAFRANLTPLFGALTLYFLLCTYQEVSGRGGLRPAPTRALIYSALTGASFGLGFYTYIAYRIMAPILFMILFWPMIAQFQNKNLAQTLKKYYKLFLVFCASFLVFVSWIADYFYHNFSYFLGRSGQVSIFNQSLYTVNGIQLTGKPPLSVVLSVFWAVLKATVVGFFVHGDLNWRQNISGYGFLSPLISPFFGIGLILVSLMGIAYFFLPNKKSGWWKYFLLTGWFWGMLLPELATAEGIPHGLRTAGSITPTFVITAWALYEFGALIYKYHQKLWAFIWQHGKTTAPVVPAEGVAAFHAHYFDHPHLYRFKFINWTLKVVVVCFCAALILQTYFLYFVYAANSPEYFYSFRADLTPVSEYLVNHCYQTLRQTGQSSKENTFLILDGFSIQTTDYLTSDPHGNFSQPCNVPYHQVDPEHAWQLPKLLPGQQVVFTQSSMFDTKKYKQYHPEAHLSLEIRNQFQEDVLAVYKTEANN